MEHHCTVTPDLNVKGLWTFSCSCGRMGGDSTQPDAEREAREHEADPEQAKLEPWDPSKHPTPNR